MNRVPVRNLRRLLSTMLVVAPLSFHRPTDALIRAGVGKVVAAIADPNPLVAGQGLAKLQARACASSCLDQCATGVTILIEPDHFFYGRVTVADVPEIIAALANDERVERLVLKHEDLERA